MTLLIGDPQCTTGLAKRIYDARVSKASVIGIAESRDALKADCFAIATAVVEEIQQNATVIPTLLMAPPGGAGGPVTGTGTVM